MSTTVVAAASLFLFTGGGATETTHEYSIQPNAPYYMAEEVRENTDSELPTINSILGAFSTSD